MDYLCATQAHAPQATGARRMTSHFLRQVVFGALAVSFAGCSFVFSKGPPDDYKEVSHFDCSGYTAPVLDTIWAALNGLGALNAAGASGREWKQQNQSYDQSTVVGVGLMWLAISGASAIYGYHNASACEDAKEEVEEMLSEEMPRYRTRRRVRHLPPKLPAAPSPPPTVTAPAATDPEAAAPSNPPQPSPTESPHSNEADPFQK